MISTVSLLRIDISLSRHISIHLGVFSATQTVLWKQSLQFTAALRNALIPVCNLALKTWATVLELFSPQQFLPASFILEPLLFFFKERKRLFCSIIVYHFRVFCTDHWWHFWWTFWMTNENLKQKKTCRYKVLCTSYLPNKNYT